MKLYLSAGFLLLFSTLACTKQKQDDLVILTDTNGIVAPAVLFEYEYVNYAWNYQHNGWIIDSHGMIHSFRQPKDWKYADSAGFISASDMYHNLKQTDSVTGRIDSATLYNKIKLIKPASQGLITEKVNTANDAGSAKLCAFIYDKSKDRYKEVFLAVSGDFTSVNTSKEARELVEWLKHFGVLWIE